MITGWSFRPNDSLNEIRSCAGMQNLDQDQVWNFRLSGRIDRIRSSSSMELLDLVRVYTFIKLDLNQDGNFRPFAGHPSRIGLEFRGNEDECPSQSSSPEGETNEP